MIFSISTFFIKRPVFATVCSIMITLLGIACIPTLPVAQYPDIAPPQVSVTSTYVGANAEVVESTVTNILERQLNGINGVKFIKSTSANNGVSQINLTFDLGTNQDLAAVDVQNRVSTVQSRLPGPVTQTGVQVAKANNNFLLAIGLYSDRDEKKNQDLYDDLYLSNYADLYLADAIRRIKGVGEVQIFGERTYAMRLWLDPERLASRTLTPQDVVAALQQQNIQVGAGQIGQSPAVPGQQYQYSVTAQGRLKDVEEFNNLVIRSTGGTLVRLRDVGRAELGAENYGSLLRFTTQDRVTHRGVGLGVNQQFGSNALDVAKAVKDEIQNLAASFPPGLHYDVAFDTTTFIDAGAREVVQSLIEAVILVVLILFLFLQDWRAAFITSIVIPIAFLGTFIFVKVLGFSINTLTLFGLTLATGLVVDDAIVIIEDITRRIQEEGKRPLEAAIESMNVLSGVVIATSLVLITVFVPVAFFPGTTGQLYRQFALTIAFSVLVSTFNALTFTPMLSALMLKPGQTRNNNWFFRRVNWAIDKTRDSYARNLDKAVRRKSLILTFFAGALVLTYFAYNFVPQAFIPDEDQGVFITVVQAPEGVSLDYTERVLEKAEAILKAQPEVANIFAVGGFSFSGATPNNGLIFTTLKPWDERTGANQSLQAIIGGFFPRPTGLFPKMASIQEAVVLPFNLPAVPGIGNFGGFEFHLQDRTGLGFPALGETLGKFLNRAAAYPSAQSPQVTGLRPNFNGNTPQISIEVDRDRANQLQVSLQDIFNTLQIFLGSAYINDFNQFNRAYRVYVQADSQFRSNPDDIKRLYVRSTPTNGGTPRMIPLGNLVRVSQTNGPSIITHYNLFRSVEINGAPAPGTSSGQAIQAMEAVARETLPRGFGFQWSGLSLEEIESGGAAVFIFGLAIVFVFLTLAAQYENYVDPFIIMLTVPLAILGALLAVILKGTANDVYTQIGFVMLIGMASKNSILIVEFANEERDRGKGIASAVVSAGRERLRPILMTAIATAIGALPLVIATGPGAAARQSLGTAIVGGMVVATFLSLFIVPVLYIVIKSLEDRIRRPARPVLVDGNGAEPVDRETAMSRSDRDGH